MYPMALFKTVKSNCSNGIYAPFGCDFAYDLTGDDATTGVADALGTLGMKAGPVNIAFKCWPKSLLSVSPTESVEEASKRLE